MKIILLDINLKRNKSVILTNTEKFLTKLIIVDGEIILKLKKIDSFSILMCLEGEILYHETNLKRSYILEKLYFYQLKLN